MHKFFLKIDEWIIQKLTSLNRLFSGDEAEKEFITPIIEELKDEQQVYIDVLMRLIQSIQHRDLEVIPESQIQLESTDIPEFFRQSRLDVLYKDEDVFLQAEAKITNPPEFSPMTETWQNIEIVLRPFVWHHMEFDITGPEPSLQQLQNWFSKWFDPKNRNKAGAHGLHGVVHMMTAPKILGNHWSVTIDFGTADIEAFHAFFKQLKFSKATKIEIGSAKYIQSLNLSAI